NHSAEKWRFKPDRKSKARPVVGPKRGGGTHSVSPRGEIGGGRHVAALQAALGGQGAGIARGGLKGMGAGGRTLRAPGGTFTPKDPVKGGDKFQCCIHPWMRLTVRKR